MSSNILMAMVLYMLIACGCSSKNHAVTEWGVMDEFHMIMAESFHPFVDSGNLQPARENAQAMLELATKWNSAPLPEKVNNDNVRKLLQDLKIESESFLASTKAGAKDNLLSEKLIGMHETFHAIQNEWYAESGEEKHHH